MAIQNYTFGPVLGEGAYGQVRLAKTNINNQEKSVAVKVLSKKSYNNEKMMELLNREITTLFSLENENIVKVYEVLETEQNYFIVMELVKGGDLLEKVMSNGSLSEAESMKIFKEIVQAVAYCHSEKVAHRDLKLENVLLRKDGHIKISDFGFAVKTEDMCSTLCGSTSYCAPEILKGQSYNAFQADMWSLGVMLFTMVFGVFPFESVSMQMNGKLSFPSSASSACKELISSLLTVDVEKRATLEQVMNSEWLN